MKEKLEQEVKHILSESTFWTQQEDLNLATEKILVIIDREKVKAELEDRTFIHRLHGS